MQAYSGRLICLTTRHNKQRALGLPFQRGLGAELQLCEQDTDRLGTFSGEIPRLSDAEATCRTKALMGMQHTGLILGLASEASFGPHPAMPLLAVGQELLIFLDQERDLCVLEQRLEWRTNYSQHELAAEQEPDRWLSQVGFPSHAVIARPAAPIPELLFKGLRSRLALNKAIEQCRSVDPEGRVWLETDMRAHCNPTRMRSIRRLGLSLVRRLRTPCPACGSPGWGLMDTKSGLPCSACRTPTELTLAELWGCSSCGARREQPRRDGLLQADPGQCPWCNP
ncbi:DUF6671 family protein [Vulcanococcus sp.]|uniref:DUF6671 family protein n=1 Tax=Vulcanococcus sp. TaxID=2856995 RepID=UPI003F69C54A